MARECQCDPDVWGPDGLEAGNGHNPMCENFVSRDAAKAAPTPVVPTTPDPFDLVLLEAAHYDLFQGKVAHANLRMIVNAARDSAARSTPAETLDVPTFLRSLANERGFIKMPLDHALAEYARLSPHNREADHE